VAPGGCRRQQEEEEEKMQRKPITVKLGHLTAGGAWGHSKERVVHLAAAT